MLRIIQGVRPPKPIFVITRGYTEDLWEMTTRCWDEKPLERPKVDDLLKALKTAAKQWKPTLSFSPQDDHQKRWQASYFVIICAYPVNNDKITSLYNVGQNFI
jgi:hypothetical protein